MQSGRLLFVLVFVMVIAGGVAVAYIVDANYDPHVNDPDYCQQYARGHDLRIPVDYLVNIKVAERICVCRWEEWPDNTMYPGITRCERRSV